MQSCFYKFNIGDGCNFGKDIFYNLMWISRFDLIDISLLNKKLKEKIKTCDLQVSNIERNPDELVVTFDVNNI